jgi:hypothetical protein
MHYPCYVLVIICEAVTGRFVLFLEICTVLFYNPAVVPALNLIFHILLLQEEDCNRKYISEIPVKTNEENQSLPVEVQVRELVTTSDNSVDKRSVVSMLFCNKRK